MCAARLCVQSVIRLTFANTSFYIEMNHETQSTKMKLYSLCHRRKHIVLLLFCFIVIFGCFYHTNYNNNNNNKRNNFDKLKVCFIPKLPKHNDNITLFDDVLESKRQPTPDRSVFIIESSCIRNRLATLTAR